jgi:FMN phosphatase YigB (HAD superfamily)
VVVSAVVFDVGETLVDETRMWERAAEVAVGNTPADSEEILTEHADLVGSSERWGIEKPAPEFFERIVDEAGFAPSQIAYVGDRVDNDVDPALAAGMVAVHIRRGPWGHLHETPAEAIRIRSFGELPEALGV